MTPQMKLEIMRAVPMIAMMSLPIALTTQASIVRCITASSAIYLGMILFSLL